MKKELCAGVVNAKNVWRNNYRHTMMLLERLTKHVDPRRLVLGTSCSLLHVPYTVTRETGLGEEHRGQLAFAEEKLDELIALRGLLVTEDYTHHPLFIRNQAVMEERRAYHRRFRNETVRRRVGQLTEADWLRLPPLKERMPLQQARLSLPILPTTTIGSFPQTPAIRRLRNDFKQGRITREAYTEELRRQIRRIIELQESIGLDVLVHGEFERNDMVEYFGKNLEGFLVTEHGWVQSYGTRCVKPPIIFGDVWRSRPLTVDWIAYAQSLTAK
ncbi:MAG: 5-methyltetrahydropteroyltriglutamate--homocysteine S-methyltransferase, partial [Firmicutes bacterium]|nr:5-methyltetrahydropteroyltriglutamate--homocysteine S-methyltransferase [Bacillota bacterium]